MGGLPLVHGCVRLRYGGMSIRSARGEGRLRAGSKTCQIGSNTRKISFCPMGKLCLPIVNYKYDQLITVQNTDVWTARIRRASRTRETDKKL